MARSLKLKPKQQRFVDTYISEYGDKRLVERQEIVALTDKHGIDWPSWLTSNMEYRAGRGLYRLPGADDSDTPALAPAIVAAAAAPGPLLEDASEVTLIQRINASERFIPDREPWFIPWGNFKDITDVIKSRLFFPVFVTGLSGNGKTLSIEQVCAKQKREMFRVNITSDTDEDDLLGGFRLIEGQTVFVPGPAVEAMERGAILLLDEIDLGTAKIMCLQPILEGKGVFLKKVGRWVKPQPGFNVLASANTKGQGNESGKFVGTNVLNEAMLDRFPITLEQDYPSEKIETKILTSHMAHLGVTDESFRDCLIQWASNIRKTYDTGEIDEIISTRRLVNVLTAFAIYHNRVKAIKLTIARFDADTKAAFLDLYTKIDAAATAATEAGTTPVTAAVTVEEDDDNDIPF